MEIGRSIWFGAETRGEGHDGMRREVRARACVRAVRVSCARVRARVFGRAQSIYISIFMPIIVYFYNYY